MAVTSVKQMFAELDCLMPDQNAQRHNLRNASLLAESTPSSESAFREPFIILFALQPETSHLTQASQSIKSGKRRSEFAASGARRKRKSPTQ
jgi:hypothetical protein